MAMLNNQMVYFQTNSPSSLLGPDVSLVVRPKGLLVCERYLLCIRGTSKRETIWLSYMLFMVYSIIFHGYWWLQILFHGFWPWNPVDFMLHVEHHRGVRTPWRWWNMSWWKAKARTARLAHGLFVQISQTPMDKTWSNMIKHGETTRRVGNGPSKNSIFMWLARSQACVSQCFSMFLCCPWRSILLWFWIFIGIYCI